MTDFIKGLDLSEAFYREEAAPLIRRFGGKLKFSAALKGFGSDVLGYDTPLSRDHMWGPRFTLFLSREKREAVGAELSSYLAESLPSRFRGYPVNFSRPDGEGIRIMEETKSERVNHLIEITSPREMFRDYLGFPYGQMPETSQWLTVSEHRLLAVTSGRIFHDDLGLGDACRTIARYPRDVALYLMASLWRMISEKEAFVGRTGELGDELGSRLNAASIVQYLMRLGFLWEGRYAPYGKWFGRAFSELSVAGELKPFLEEALRANDWKGREEALCKAYLLAGREQNRLALSPEKPEVKISSYYNRPYRVIFAERFADALTEGIRDPFLKGAPKIGSVPHFSDVCPLYEDRGLTEKLRILYEEI